MRSTVTNTIIFAGFLYWIKKADVGRGKSVACVGNTLFCNMEVVKVFGSNPVNFFVLVFFSFLLL